MKSKMLTKSRNVVKPASTAPQNDRANHFMHGPKSHDYNTGTAVNLVKKLHSK
jgi:hypothetical protein